MTDYILPTTEISTSIDIDGNPCKVYRNFLSEDYGDFEISSGSLYLNDSTRGSLYVAGENSFVCNTFSIFDSYANKQEGTANNISIGYISGVPTIKLSNTQSSLHISSLNVSGINRLTFDYDTTAKKGIQGTTTTTSTAILGITAGLLDNLSSGSSIFMYGNQTTSKQNSMDIWGTNTSTSVLSINYFKGGVGINTANPTSGYALDVNGSLNVSGSSTFNSPTTFNTTTILGNFWSDVKSYRLRFQSNVDNEKTRLSIAPNGSGTVSSLDIYNGSDLDNSGFSSFYIGPGETSIRSVAASATSNILPLRVYMVQDKDNTVKPTSTLSLTSSGVGINTATPTSEYALDVNGNLKVSGSSTFNSPTTFNTTTILGNFWSDVKSYRLRFQSNVDNEKTRLSIAPNGSGTVSSLDIYNGSDLDNSGFSSFYIGPGETSIRSVAASATSNILPLRVYMVQDKDNTVKPTSTLSLTSSGVGINTATPTSGYALDVNGDLIVEGSSTFKNTATFTTANTTTLNVTGSSTFTSPTTFNTTTILGNFWSDVKSYRLRFQSNVDNEKTRLSIAPNGSGTVSSLDIYNGSELDNSGFSSFYIGSGETSIRSVAASATSNILPLRVYMVQEKTNTTLPTPTLSLTSSGVGINTKDPTSGYALDVHGLIKADSYTVSGRSGFLKANGNIDDSTYLTSIADITTLKVTGSSTFNGDLIFDATSATKQDKVLRMSDTASSFTIRGGNSWTSSGAVLQLFGKDNNSGNAKLLSGVAGSTLELSFNGGVGINTANPTSGYALDVNGGLVVSGTIWSKSALYSYNALYAYVGLYIPTWDNLNQVWDSNLSRFYYDKTYNKLCIMYANNVHSVQLV